MFLIAICNVHYNFTAIDVGQHGSNNVSGVLLVSKMGKKNWKRSLSCSCSRKDAWLYKANAIFFCWWRNLSVKALEHAGKQMADGARKFFNYRLSRACKIIENTFGILVSKCKIFQKLIEGTPERIEKIIPATVALYNYLNQTDHAHYSPTGFIDSEDGAGEIIGDGEDISPTTF